MVTSRQELESEGFTVGKTREKSKARRKGQKTGTILCSCKERSSDTGSLGDRALSGNDCKCSVISGGRSVRVAKAIADNPTADLQGLGSETRIPSRELSGISRVFIQKSRSN